MEENIFDRELSTWQKSKVIKRDGFRCRYCGNKVGPFEYDHVYPYAKGGETSIQNSVIACRRCNRKKSSKVGIWPKPIGHFEIKKDIDLSYVFLVALGLSLVGNGYWNIVDPIKYFTFIGSTSMWLGIFVLSVTLTKTALGK